MLKATSAFWKGSRDHPALSGKTLLELFSPERAVDPPGRRHDLWADDAVHRTKNLAQLSSSLGRLRHLLGPDAEMHTSRADALSRAYDELGATEMITGDVPCTALLEIIATNLLGLFSGDRSIRLHLLVDHVTMPAEQRRALLLIASELIINALKYAFPAQGTGAIWLRLTQARGEVELSVADDGCGASAQDHVGSGAGLMARLAVLLAADMYRVDNSPGLKVGLLMQSRKM